MKLLTAGYGAGNGPNMVLLCPSRVVSPALEEVLLGYSCFPPALPKIRQCLKYSGRYDAWIQPGWIFSQHREVKRDLKAIGVLLFITSVPEVYHRQAKRCGLKWGPLPSNIEANAREAIQVLGAYSWFNEGHGPVVPKVTAQGFRDLGIVNGYVEAVRL